MRHVWDLTGRAYGRLLVIERSPGRPRERATYFECTCRCGNRVRVRGSDLRRQFTTSCGCWRVEQALARFEEHMRRLPRDEKGRVMKTDV